MLPTLLFLLACVHAVHSSVVTFSPKSSTLLPPAIHPTAHLTFSLDAHHSLSTPSTFHPLSTSSSPTSRFSLLQALVADSNMTGCGSIDFSGLVTVNNQGPFRLIIDSGSTTLAVVSSSCPNCDSAYPTYTPPAGSQGNNGQTVTATYGGGTSWTGHVYSASVALGDSQAVSMAIGAIESNGGFINSNDICAVNSGAKTGLNTSQGIIGFAYPSIALQGTDSWISRYVSTTGVSNEFTIQMCPRGGNVWVGDYDGTFTAGQFTYLDIIKPFYFSVLLTGISVISSSGASQSTGYTQSTFGPCQSNTGNDCTILDSGTTLILLPQNAYTTLVALIRADSYYKSVFDGLVTSTDPLQDPTSCAPASTLPSLATLNSKLPHVSFTFASADLSTTQTFTLNPINSYLSTNYDESGNAYYCTGLGVTTGASLLGYSFMNQYTVRHDLQNQRVGLAVTAQCGVAAAPLASYHWQVGQWGVCGASCGGGVQWRQVNCTDQYGVKHADLACATVYLAARPIDSQECNTGTCSTVTAPTFTAVTASATSMTPGHTYTITFTYTGTDPSSIVLFLSPTSSTSTFPSYVARNATASGGQGSYTFTVPSTIPTGTYHLGAYANQYTATSAFTSSTTVTIATCTSGLCGADPCAAGASACSGHGECDAVNNAAVCTCAPGWTGTTCSTSANTGAINCQNGGSLTAAYTCSCPASITGPLCEQPYANLSATFNQASPFTTASQPIFTSSLTTDLAYALGVFPDQLTIQSLTTTSASLTTVAFAVQAQSSIDDLRTLVESFVALPLTSPLLQSGLTTSSLTSVSVLSEPTPPSSGSGTSAREWLARYGPYIAAGVGGFLVVFLILYCLAGGRCGECRRKEERGNDKRMQNVAVRGSASAHR